MAVYFGEWKQLVVLSVLTLAIFDSILGSAVDPADGSPAMELKDLIAVGRKIQHEYRGWFHLNVEQFTQIIDAHNQIRNEVAGDQTQGAADLYVLSWDKNLYEIAEELRDNKPPFHEGGGAQGTGKNYGYYTDLNHLASAVNQWKINESAKPDNLTDLTAQILWAATRNIYCVGTTYDNEPEIVCTYDVESVAGTAAYQVGTPCTACKCDAKWKNLCAVEEAGGPGSGLAGKLAVSTWLCLGCSLAVSLL